MTPDGPAGPEGAGFADGVLSTLLARRVVVVHGELDTARASEVAAALLTLDATGDDHIDLRLSAPSGSFDAGLMVIDVIDVLGVPVHTTAIGVVGGGAVGVLAAGARRVVARHARLHLREPDTTVEGRAVDIERAVAEQASRREAFYRHLARCTARRVGEIETEWSPGRYLDADDAVSLGYADSAGS